MSRARQKLPESPVTAQVEKFSHDGRGIARVDGKITFIQNALPGEMVTFQYTRMKKDFDEGRVVSVLEPSPHRVEPACPHYTLCGGCSLQHLDQPLQLHEKQNLLLDLLARTGHCQPESILTPLSANPWNYRNKARLSVRFVEKKQAVLMGFREKNNPRYITEMSQCLILNAKFNAQFQAVRDVIHSLDNPHCIAQIELASGDDEVALIFRNLEPLSTADENKLKTFAQATQFRIFLQPGGPASVTLLYPEDGRVYLTYQLPDEGMTFQFHPTDFTQINAELNRAMVARALTMLELKKTDRVLDLFCGLGNFSLPIANHCASLVGIEGSEAMVERAQMNAQANGLVNTKFFAANLEEPLPPHVLSDSFNKILLDPPRAGAMALVQHMDILNPERIVYVSCNPATLARDADVLVNQKGYRLVSAGVMDMFPHTAHVESVALFIKG